MKKTTDQQKEKEQSSVPDLKHDTMEFAAPTDGEDKLDFDDETYEEEEITPEELDTMEDDTIDNQGYALVAAQTDKTADSEDLPDEDWEDDLPDNDSPAEENGEYRRPKRK